MFKKSRLPFIVIVGLFLFAFQWYNALQESETKIKIDKTYDISLSKFVKMYQNNQFSGIFLKWETQLYWLKPFTWKEISFVVLPNINQKHYIAYKTLKPITVSLSDLWISITSWTKEWLFFDYEQNDINYKQMIIENLIPLVFLFLLIWFMFKKPWSKWWLFPFNISVWKLSKKNESTTKFSDIAWMEEVKEELKEVIDYLKNPKKYLDVWARPPKWILLYWVPWSWKTLLAKAVAWEANAAFFSTSGSEFMEMLVGMWAAKVRELFAKAKAAAPSIIFIDEIDAIWKKRWIWYSGWHQEQEQTLNQILTEMDWFSPSTNVIVIAATNRPDTLDPALMRSWRFDRKIMVGTPTLEERKEILLYYLKNKKVEKNVDIDSLARRTSWFVWADIENMVNEASLKVAKEWRKVLTVDDFEYALEKIVMWPEKKIKTMNEEERKLIAYHELWHAICAHNLSHSDPVEKISIVSRWRALGVTRTMPTEDKYLTSKAKFYDELVKLLWWRASEEIFFGEENITTWASNDLQRATEIAKNMIMKYWMDKDIGQIFYLDAENDEYNWRLHRYSEETAKKIDEKIKNILNNAYEEAKKLIQKHKKLIEHMSKILLEKEYLTKEEFEKIIKEFEDNNK